MSTLNIPPQPFPTSVNSGDDGVRESDESQSALTGVCKGRVFLQANCKPPHTRVKPEMQFQALVEAQS